MSASSATSQATADGGAIDSYNGSGSGADWLTIVSVGIGLVGICLTVFLIIRSRKK
jgi:hypothetical protein